MTPSKTLPRTTRLRRLSQLFVALSPLLLAACSTVAPTVTQDLTLPRVQLRGHWLHAEAHGPANAPVLIVLHGGPGADYRYLLGLQALADRYRVVFYDQLGSGLSERVPAEQITVQSFIDDLDAVVAHFGRQRPVHLLGHSWGAMLASAYAGAHPDKIASLVLAEPGFLDQASLAGLQQRGAWPGWRQVAGVSAAWLGQWLVRGEGDAYARDDWFVQQMVALAQPATALCEGRLPPLQGWRGGSPAFQATLGRMMSDKAYASSLDFSRGLAQLQAPVLFLRGSCNEAQGEAHQRRMMALFPPASQARLQRIDGAGHFMFNDQPAASLGAVRQFLDARSG
ncbi:alpha/beta hydrolase [Paucibacter sp. APW11]|uniref:Alpha/beta hydrolase n=1 Tax=Roseateles aquae TaxID=3077235 RepID=A0ABU3PH66_9BURK|nr:alpha/beta hydrolase [Paucibacter sp. APW11]MDT9001799.1 alpha/beta hydrolase [Paucibacter sp. APW11]